MIFKELGISMLINFAFMIVTYGIRAPGGVFIPSMVIGATFGRLVGVTYEILQSTQYLPGAFRGVTVIPGVYALIGAASVVSGVTRISISLSVIMFEITGALNLVLPLMLSVIIAKIIGDVLEKESLYDWIITEKGYPFINHKKTFVAASASAMDIMKINTPTLRINSCYSYDEMRIILNQQGLYILKLEVIYPTFDGGFPILSSDGVLVAYIRQSDVIRAFGTSYLPRKCQSR
jgi:chloride channel 3/4/5